jgi:hypothetical protein
MIFFHRNFFSGIGVCQTYVDRVQKKIISLIHKNFQNTIIGVHMTNLGVENNNLTWFKSSIDFCFEKFVLRILNYDISIIEFMAINKEKHIIVINATPDGLLSDMRKEVLTSSFKDIVLRSIGENYLIGIIGNLTHHTGSPFRTENRSDLFRIIIIIYFKYSDDFSASFPTTGDGTFVFIFSTLPRIQNDV